MCDFVLMMRRSRLCCQLRVTKELDGAVFKVPAETNNML
jgi:ferredoxin